MKPIVLIHGYSAEGDDPSKKGIKKIYGAMPSKLKDRFGNEKVFELNLGRYISLDDGITIDDISRALDKAFQSDYNHLLKDGFNVITHSTGALVIRNWIRNHSAKPSPIENIIHLAGANLGSGWAHIGKGQFAKWGRLVFDQTERGVQVLNALELGSDWTLDLHLSFLETKNDMQKKYKIKEHVIVGSQVSASFIEAPIRYAKEDGSDGVVRVAASNINFNHVRFEPIDEAKNLSWKHVQKLSQKDRSKSNYRMDELYKAKTSIAGKYGRPYAPFAIPYECAHSGDEKGIVKKDPNAQVLDLIELSLNPKAESPQTIRKTYEEATKNTYSEVKNNLSPRNIIGRLWDPRNQSDKHAQIIFRLKNQSGIPVNIENADIFFKSHRKMSISELIEDKHLNKISPNILTFYLRVAKYEDDEWQDRVSKLGSLDLRINVVETDSDNVEYVPLQKSFKNTQLTDFLKPHTTTIVDVILWRTLSEAVFKIV